MVVTQGDMSGRVPGRCRAEDALRWAAPGRTRRSQGGPKSQHPAGVGKFRAEAVPHSTKLCKNPLCSGERETSLGSSGLYQKATPGAIP